jgi:hypothetical protein
VPALIVGTVASAIGSASRLLIQREHV